MNSNKYIVLDLESTCDDSDSNRYKEQQEIIEIGAVICDINGEIFEKFDIFVKPVINPVLTEFCKDLTSITQNDVDNGLLIKDALIQLDKFLLDNKTKYPELLLWGSWGFFDKSLLSKCSDRVRKNDQNFVLNILDFKYTNFSIDYANKNNKGRKVGVRKALAKSQLSFIGTPHRAIDDVINIAQLIKYC